MEAMNGDSAPDRREELAEHRRAVAERMQEVTENFATALRRELKETREARQAGLREAIHKALRTARVIDPDDSTVPFFKEDGFLVWVRPDQLIDTIVAAVTEPRGKG